MTTPVPVATYLEDENHFLWADVDIEIIVERIREERGALRGDFSPQSASGRGYLPTQTIDLVSGESAKRYANVLGSRILDGDAWFTMITQAQRLTRERYRSGEPSVVLRDVEWGQSPRFLVFPLVEDGARCILFGDGGVSKSLHAMAVAVSVATGAAIIPGSRIERTGPVMYLDWEDEASTHAERLEAICAGAGIATPENLIYMRRVGSLHESTREIRREIARTGAVMAIVDSVGAACGGDPERAADVIRTFDAMRALGVTVLAIHHVPKDAKDRSKPFGSVYAVNLVRLMWRLDREPGAANEMFVRGQNFKGNNTGELAPIGHRVIFEVDDDNRLEAVRFTTAPTSKLPPLAGNGLRNRIAAALKGGAMTVRELAIELEVGEGTVRTQLNRHKGWFQKLEDGRWGAADDERTSGTYQPVPVVRTNVPEIPPSIRGDGTGDMRDEREEEGWQLGDPF